MAAGKISRVAVAKSTTAKDVKQDKAIRSLQRKVATNRPHLLFHKLAGTAQSVTASAPFSLLMNNLTLGTGSAKFTGTGVRSSYFEVRLLVRNTVGVTDDGLFRVIVFQDKNPRGVARTLFDTSTPSTKAIYDYNAKNIFDNFKIYHDQTYSLDDVWRLTQPIVIKKKIKFRSDQSRSNVGDITDIDNGALWLQVISETTTANDITVDYSTMYSYMDV